MSEAVRDRPQTIDGNIARSVTLMAQARPAATALKIPRGRTRKGEIDYLALTFAELETEVAAWMQRLAHKGIQRGDRTLIMVRPGLPLIASVFATFRLGAIPIIIDPGMGRKTFLDCVARSRPRAMVGIPTAQLISRMFRTAFRTMKVRVGASSSLTARLPAPHGELPAGVPSASTDLAAILFTSGSTGAPKGVCFEHGMFAAQVQAIRDTYGIAPGEIDLPLLPVFALFNPALGMTTVVPEIDPRRPAAFDPARIVQAIRQENVTNSFGSPTLWQKIADHCNKSGDTLPSVRRVLCAGATVPAALWRSTRGWLPNGELHSPYGATEALPVASVSSRDIDLDSTQGACVGRPLNGVEIKIIAVSDEPIASLTHTQENPPGVVGEIVVRGPMVTKRYDDNPAADARAKIPAPDGAGAETVWHRMGDCGFRNGEGRLWFCGRKAERIETVGGTLFPEPCEQVFRHHPRAQRCALIGLGERGRQRPAMVVETAVKDSSEARGLARELRVLGRAHAHTAGIKTFYFREDFPVDVRHNAKIHRLELARWAASAKGYESDPKR